MHVQRHMLHDLYQIGYENRDIYRLFQWPFLVIWWCRCKSFCSLLRNISFSPVHREGNFFFFFLNSREGNFICSNSHFTNIYMYEWKMLISPHFLAVIQFPIWLLFLNKTKRIKILTELLISILKIFISITQTLNTFIGTNS